MKIGIIISIVLMLLSVVIVVGTWLFIKNDAKSKSQQKKAELDNKNKHISKNRSKNKEMINKNKINNIWDIEEDNIKNNMIILKDNRYSAILSVSTIDFNLLSIDEQTVVENILRDTALQFQYCVQFYSTTHNIDTSSNINEIQENMIKENNVHRISYAKHYSNFLSTLMNSRNISVRKNYIIISYDGPLDKASSELNRRCAMVQDSLKRKNITTNVLETNEIIDLLHGILNKNSSFKPSDSVQRGSLSLYVGTKEEKKNAI
ncbi:hypothetical protein [Clostridium botulinum]|uniref:hypothetical protein n=1 Tax=Clostridium botulinum TaxID=1491 RepID=UPI00311AB3C6